MHYFDYKVNFVVSNRIHASTIELAMFLKLTLHHR